MEGRGCSESCLAGEDSLNILSPRCVGQPSHVLEGAIRPHQARSGLKNGIVRVNLVCHDKIGLLYWFNSIFQTGISVPYI